MQESKSENGSEALNDKIVDAMERVWEHGMREKTIENDMNKKKKRMVRGFACLPSVHIEPVVESEPSNAATRRAQWQKVQELTRGLTIRCPDDRTGRQTKARKCHIQCSPHKCSQ